MKKILIAIFAVVVTAMWVVPAMALDTTFNAQYRVRTIMVDNATDLNKDVVDDSSWIDQRFRLGITLKEAPVTGFVQLQMGDYTGTTGSGATLASEAASGPNDSHVWGTGGGENFDVQVRQAWLDFPIGPIGLRLGRTYASHGFLGGGIFENIADRFILTYKVNDDVTTSFIHAKARETKTAGPAAGANDNDRNIYNLGGTFKMGDTGDAAARIYYVADGGQNISGAAGDWSATWLTAQANLKFDPVNVYVSAAYLTGTSKTQGSTTSVDLNGYAVHGDVNANFGPAKAGLVVGMGTGDEDASDNKANTFFAPGGASYIQSVLFFQSGENNYSIGSIGNSALNVQNGSRETLSNVTWFGIYGDYKATDDLSLSAKFATFQQTNVLKKDATGATVSGKSADIGTEIDLIASYKLHKDLSLLAAIAQFTPGNGYSGKDTNSAAKSDTISAYYARLQWEF